MQSDCDKTAERALESVIGQINSSPLDETFKTGARETAESWTREIHRDLSNFMLLDQQDPRGRIIHTTSLSMNAYVSVAQGTMKVTLAVTADNLSEHERLWNKEVPLPIKPTFEEMFVCTAPSPEGKHVVFDAVTHANTSFLLSELHVVPLTGAEFEIEVFSEEPASGSEGATMGRGRRDRWTVLSAQLRPTLGVRHVGPALKGALDVWRSALNPHGSDETVKGNVEVAHKALEMALDGLSEGFCYPRFESEAGRYTVRVGAKNLVTADEDVISFPGWSIVSCNTGRSVRNVGHHDITFQSRRVNAGHGDASEKNVLTDGTGEVEGTQLPRESASAPDSPLSVRSATQSMGNPGADERPPFEREPASPTIAPHPLSGTARPTDSGPVLGLRHRGRAAEPSSPPPQPSALVSSPSGLFSLSPPLGEPASGHMSIEEEGATEVITESDLDRFFCSHKVHYRYQRRRRGSIPSFSHTGRVQIDPDYPGHQVQDDHDLVLTNEAHAVTAATSATITLPNEVTTNGFLDDWNEYWRTNAPSLHDVRQRERRRGISGALRTTSVEQYSDAQKAALKASTESLQRALCKYSDLAPGSFILPAVSECFARGKTANFLYYPWWILEPGDLQSGQYVARSMDDGEHKPSRLYNKGMPGDSDPSQSSTQPS
jgi:hypothetical protein